MAECPDYALTVLGAGSWGTALAIACSRNQHSVCLWGHEKQHIAHLKTQRENTRYLPNVVFPDSLVLSDDLDHAVKHARHILMAMPSHAFRGILRSLKLSPGQGLLIATKGLDPNTHQLLDDVICDEISIMPPTAALSGPSFAKEVAKGLPTAVTIAYDPKKTDLTFINTMIKLFHSHIFRVYQNTDLMGVEISGAVKNVLAIATGISDGLGFGANARAALMTRGLQEMIRLGTAIGAQQDTFSGLAGMGDLVLTCTDNQSRNRRFGLALGQGQSSDEAQKTIGQVVEGFHNTKAIYELARHYDVSMPIVTEVHDILFMNKKASDAVKSLMTREPKTE